MPSSSYDSEPDIDWLQQAADRKLELTGINVWKALRHRAYIQVLDAELNVLTEVKRLDKCKSFRVTQRGHDLLEGAGTNLLPFNKSDPPLNIRLWISAFRRWTRNCPKGLHLCYEDGQLHVLAEDKDGKVKNDGAHRISSMKVPWYERKK